MVTFVICYNNLCKQFGPRSVSNLFATLIVPLKEFFEKVFEKSQQMTTKACKSTQKSCVYKKLVKSNMELNILLIRPNKKIPVFRVTQPYLNLLVKPRFFSGFLKKYNFMHFERPFKMHKIIFFSRIKND